MQIGVVDSIRTRLLLAGTLLALVVSSNTSVAQGTIYFSNYVPEVPIDAPYSNLDGTRLSGPDFQAVLYGGPDSGSLEPIGAPTPFLSGQWAGYFDGGVRVVNSVAPGDTGVFEVRSIYWPDPGLDPCLLSVGNQLRIATGMDPESPAYLNGLQGVSLIGYPSCIPEPRSLGLFSLGLLLLASAQTPRKGLSYFRNLLTAKCAKYAK